MPDPAHGAGGVVRELVRAASDEHARSIAAAAGEQIAMFEPPTRFHGPRREAVRAAVARQTAAGRPPGAQNLSNKAFREYLQKMGVSPLVQLMRFAQLPPDLLAQELGCSRLEAFREWRILQVELAPYLHARMIPVDDDGKVPPFLQMVFGAADQAAGEADLAPWLRARPVNAADLQIEQNQALAPARPAVSHDTLSHEGTE